MRAALPALLIAAAVGACGSHPDASPTTARLAVPPPAHVTARPAPAAQAPPAACRTASACVDLRTHSAWLLRGGDVAVGPVPVSTGGAGHATPRGTFDVAWKDRVHTSSSYGLPMPYSVFFASGGIAFHEGDVRHPSHGCVHLRHGDAVRFFQALHRGDEVRVL